MTEARKILILGGGGFLGQALARSLIGSGYATTRLDCRPMQPLFEQERQFVGDLSDLHLIQPLLQECDTLVHLASGTTPSSSAANPSLESELNIAPTLRLLELAQTAPLRHIIFVSSGGTVYGNPAHLPAGETSPMAPRSYHAAGKMALEGFMHAFQQLTGKTATILRPSNLYGPGQTLRQGFGIIRTMLDHARTGGPMTVWGDGENIRDYLYIDDMVSACRSVIERGQDNETFNVGVGAGTSIRQLQQLIEQVTGKKIPIQYQPSRALDVRTIVLDCAKLRHATGWTPAVSLEEGIYRTWQWLNSNP